MLRMNILSLSAFPIVTLFLSNVDAQFPRRCTTEEALAARECCPHVSDNYGVRSKCGEHLGYGSCTDILILSDESDDEMRLELIFDDRKNWPTAFYDKGCRCNGNFDGIDCSRCRLGYAGVTCEHKKPLLIRKDIRQWPKKKINEFMQNLNKSKYTQSEEYVILTTSYDKILSGESPTFTNISIYDLFVWMHYYASRDNLVPDNKFIVDESSTPVLDHSVNIFQEMDQGESNFKISNYRDYAHEGPAFLPWHRYFLMKWEEEFARNIAKDRSFTLPYWDWREEHTCDVCTDEMFGGKSQSQPQLISGSSLFSEWQIICSKSGDEDYLLFGKQCDGSPEGPLKRNYGEYDVRSSSGLPSHQDVTKTLQLPSYETFPYNRYAKNSFRNVMEGFADPEDGDYLEGYSTMHNAVHLFMNGTMSEVGSSANDPLFIVHHAFVDSLYDKWLQKQSQQNLFMSLNRHRTNLSVGHKLQDFMVPFFPLVRQIEGFRIAEELGYTYDEKDVYSGSGFGILEDDKETSYENKKNEKQSDILDYIYSPLSADENEEYLAEGHFEALVRVEGSQENERMGNEHGISRVRRLSKVRKRVREKLTLKALKRPVGEGGVFLNRFSPGEEIFYKSGAAVARVDTEREINASWDLTISYMYGWQRYFFDLSTGEQVVLLLVAGISLICLVILLTMCCSSCRNRSRVPPRSPKKESQCKDMTCFRKKDLAYDDEESQCLLQTRGDGKLKKKIAKGHSYTLQDGKVPFNEI